MKKLIGQFKLSLLEKVVKLNYFVRYLNESIKIDMIDVIDSTN